MAIVRLEFGGDFAICLELCVALKGPTSDVAKEQDRFGMMHNVFKGSSCLLCLSARELGTWGMSWKQSDPCTHSFLPRLQRSCAFLANVARTFSVTFHEQSS